MSQTESVYFLTKLWVLDIKFFSGLKSMMYSEIVNEII